MKRLILTAAAALMILGAAGPALAGGRVYVYTSGGRGCRTYYYGTRYYPRRYYYYDRSYRRYHRRDRRRHHRRRYSAYSRVRYRYAPRAYYYYRY